MNDPGILYYTILIEGIIKYYDRNHEANENLFLRIKRSLKVFKEINEENAKNHQKFSKKRIIIYFTPILKTNGIIQPFKPLDLTMYCIFNNNH